MEPTKSAVKVLYPYQQRDLQSIFDHMESTPNNHKLLYQLPTGGGKTLVFSEIAKRFLDQSNKTVAILTHRKELCQQTSTTLKNLGVPNRIINSTGGNFKPDCDCYVAMVETLRNRIKEKKIKTDRVGLVIIDEAHHNSFRKLLSNFKNAYVIGVTATPFSADVSKPMNRHYDALITGATITTLIENGFLAQPKSVAVDVELNSLKTGIHGDYTVSSSNELYGSAAMQSLLLQTYASHAIGKKTLIFNNGIETSVKVQETFAAAGIPVRHLDNKTSAEQRTAILKWFRKTKDAVLTSVSILTTGFDEPTVQAVILNRATTSLTLYHQMIGRGSRRLPTKKKFLIIDLGNNIQRFGEWQNPVDWKYVFDHPAQFAQQLQYQSGSTSSVQSHALPAEIRAQFPNTLELTFDIEMHYQEALDMGQKPKVVIRQSIRQQALMCIENAESLTQALALADALDAEIQWRVKQYVQCLEKASKSYKDWLLEDYKLSLRKMIQKVFHKMN